KHWKRLPLSPLLRYKPLAKLNVQNAVQKGYIKTGYAILQTEKPYNATYVEIAAIVLAPQK
ncbi:hypothetical protein DRO41_06635, partial [Candidatus Bathyarchaeota archaeon]